jgi:hypothetical protein
MSVFPSRLVVHPDDFARATADVREECERHGIDPATVEVIANIGAKPLPPRGPRLTLAQARERRMHAEAKMLERRQLSRTMPHTGPR